MRMLTMWVGMEATRNVKTKIVQTVHMLVVSRAGKVGSYRHTQDEEPKRIVVLRCIRAIRRLDSKRRRQDGCVARVEESCAFVLADVLGWPALS